VARPAKTLLQLVAGRSFMARRHRDLLAGPTLPDVELAQLQARFAAAAGEAERRAVAVEFERFVRGRPDAAEEDDDMLTLDEMFAAEEELGPVALVGTCDRRFRRRDQRIASILISYAQGAMTLAQIADMHRVSVRTARRDLEAALNAQRSWPPALARCADLARRRTDAS
jgi:hypothetical protein